MKNASLCVLLPVTLTMSTNTLPTECVNNALQTGSATGHPGPHGSATTIGMATAAANATTTAAGRGCGGCGGQRGCG